MLSVAVGLGSRRHLCDGSLSFAISPPVVATTWVGQAPRIKAGIAREGQLLFIDLIEAFGQVNKLGHRHDLAGEEVRGNSGLDFRLHVLVPSLGSIAPVPQCQGAVTPLVTAGQKLPDVVHSRRLIRFDRSSWIEQQQYPLAQSLRSLVAPDSPSTRCPNGTRCPNPNSADSRSANYLAGRS